MTEIHTCSYQCERPECIRAQRDELASRLGAETSNARGDAEAKTVPVPTRVHLIGETAVIVGTPGRGWDEEGPDAHNCDAMGCATIGPHVLARVPFTDERTLTAAQQQGQEGGGERKGCGDPTCGCDWPSFTEPMEALRFLSGRMKYAGIAEGVARSYARDIDDILAKYDTAPPPSVPVGVDKETERRLIDVAASMLNDNNGKIGKRHFRADATAVVRRVLKALAQHPAAVDEDLAVRVVSHYETISRGAVSFTPSRHAVHCMLAALTAALATQHQEPTT